MKSYAFFFLSIIWATLRLDAQTCPGAPLTLSTQSQVNNFPTNYPGCTEVGVSITISGSNITNLNGLSQLQSITKSLFILNCPALTSLSGLSNLTNISVELTIDNCDALTTLNGLQNLPFIGGSLTISGNALLNNISALSGIDYINGVLQITQNPALTNLTGLENVTFTGRYLQINGNNGLTSIGSLSSLTQVGNNVNTNGRYLVISHQHGWNSTDLYFKDLAPGTASEHTDDLAPGTASEHTADLSPGTADLPAPGFTPLVAGVPAIFDLTAWRGAFYLHTNDGAPRYRVFKVDPARPARPHWRELIAESEATLAGIQVTGERLGLIRFGSRCDVYLPAGIEPLVLLGQRTLAGETVLADLLGDRKSVV